MTNTLNIITIGDLRLVLTDEYGNVKVDRTEKNLITTAGKAYIASRIVSDSASLKVSHMAIGSGSAAAVVGDTTLGTELGRSALTTQTSTGAVATCTATFAPGVGTGAIAEAGILNAASGGTLLNRSVFSVVNKAAADTLTISWTITAS